MSIAFCADRGWAYWCVQFRTKSNRIRNPESWFRSRPTTLILIRQYDYLSTCVHWKVKHWFLHLCTAVQQTCAHVQTCVHLCTDDCWRVLTWTHVIDVKTLVQSDVGICTEVRTVLMCANVFSCVPMCTGVHRCELMCIVVYCSVPMLIDMMHQPLTLKIPNGPRLQIKKSNPIWVMQN